MTPPPATINGRSAARISSTARASAASSGSGRAMCQTRFAKNEIDRQELVRLMAGGRELAELEHELEAIRAEVASS